MNGQQLWGNITCKRENCENSPVQFLCFEEGCKSNVLCQCCISSHQHQGQMMAIGQFEQKIQVLETEQICRKAQEDYNQNKKKQLQSYEKFINLLKINFETLQANQNKEFFTNMDYIKNLKQEIKKPNGFSEISNLISKLSKLMSRTSDGSLKLKEIKLFTNGSLESLKNMIEQSYKTNLEPEIIQKIQPKIVIFKNQNGEQQQPGPFVKLQLSHSQSVANFDASSKIKIILPSPIIENRDNHNSFVQNPDNTTRIKNNSIVQNPKIQIVQNPQKFTPNAVRLNQFNFSTENTQISIIKNGKAAEQQQINQNLNRLAYLTPNLDLVNETTISFQCSKPDLSKYRSQFGIFVCDQGVSEYPKIYSSMDDTEVFYLFKVKKQLDRSEILKLTFKRNQLMLEFQYSKGRTESIKINEQKNQQFVFCFVVQPGNVISLIN